MKRGSKIGGNQSMEQNDDDDQGSSDQPTVIEDCAIYFSSDVVVEMLLTHIYSTT